MSSSKKIILSLPEELLQQVDGRSNIENKNRSEWIREAIVSYLKESDKARIREAMKRGYEEMGMLNLWLSEEGLEKDEKNLSQYEKSLNMESE